MKLYRDKGMRFKFREPNDPFTLWLGTTGRAETHDLFPPYFLNGTWNLHDWIFSKGIYDEERMIYVSRMLM